ncbi:MAG: PIN domain-containing protein [Melioribacteraceae bacterium]|nr:PIN domain-containing protein [Melioribacteraceae bacterium]
MNVIIDTAIWSLALRRKKKLNYIEVFQLEKLIENYQTVMLGVIRQEILSGIKEESQFKILKEYLRAFPDKQINTKDYETATEFFNICRKKGVQASNTDYLICAVAANNGFEIFTNDKDFNLLKKYLPIKLFTQ